MLATLLLLAVAALDTRARIELGSERPQIGEPFEITFVVEHAADAEVKWPDPQVLPREFAFLGERGTTREIDPSNPDAVTTRARWSLMVLEGGDVTLPALDVGLHEKGGDQVLHVEGPKLVVPHALAPDEDAPRPSRGFRDVVAPPTAASRIAWVVGAVLAVLALLVTRSVLRRKRPVPPQQPASLVERFSALESRIAAEPERSREHVFALTALLRTAVDEHAGVVRAAASDEEWARAVEADERVPEGTRTAAVKLLAEAERVKYAGEPMSSLGLRDALERTRAAVLALGGKERTAA